MANYGKPFFFRWDREMNGTWVPWGKEAAENPELFVHAWQRFHEIADEAGATNITWVWCPNVSSELSTPLARLYPGNGYVDWVCVDGYNFGTNPLRPAGWTSFHEVFWNTYQELQAIASGKPIMIGETASTESGGSKAAWIEDALKVQIPNSFPRIRAINWFNWPDEGWDWPIESSSSAKKAFAEAISSPYYATNTFGSLPPLTKIEPLP